MLLHEIGSSLLQTPRSVCAFLSSMRPCMQRYVVPHIHRRSSAQYVELAIGCGPIYLCMSCLDIPTEPC